MNAKEANQVNISSYLSNLGIKPTKMSKGFCFYHSPYRTERTPSFKVFNTKNLWVDYGDNNAGGTLIDMFLKMNPGMGIREAIENISKVSGNRLPLCAKTKDSFSPPENSEPTESRVKIIGIEELGNNLALTAYLYSRGIGLDTPKAFCKEVY